MKNIARFGWGKGRLETEELDADVEIVAAKKEKGKKDKGKIKILVTHQVEIPWLLRLVQLLIDTFGPLTPLSH